LGPPAGGPGGLSPLLQYNYFSGMKQAKQDQEERKRERGMLTTKGTKNTKRKRANTLFSCPFVFFVVIFLRGSVKKIFNHERHEKHEKEKRANTLFSCPFVFFVVIFLRGSKKKIFNHERH
jgi:cell division protein FtsI/penicillin-binding protein 2